MVVREEGKRKLKVDEDMEVNRKVNEREREKGVNKRKR